MTRAYVYCRFSSAKQEKGDTGGNGQEQVRNLFVGLVRCGHCGSAMTLVGNSAKPARYLLCINASRGRGCTQKKAFAYRPFEKAALDQMLELALDEEFFERPDETQAVRIEIANVEKSIGIKQDAATTSPKLWRLSSHRPFTRWC